MTGKKRFCKIYKVGYNTVFCVCPKGGKFKAVACFALTEPAALMLLYSISAGAVGIIFCVGTIRYNKNLHILIKPAACSKGVP